jgi:hypothetical protein
MKINVDGGFCKERAKGCWGFIIRDGVQGVAIGRVL